MVSDVGRRPRCFLSIPLEPGGQQLVGAIQSALKHEGVDVFYRQGARTDRKIEVLDALYRSDFYIFDITKPDPTDMYELGQVHAQRRPTILIRSLHAKGSPPADLGHFYHLIYDPNDLNRFTELLQGEARRTMARYN